MVLARWLGPAGLGLYALGWGAFRLLTLPATAGLNNGVQRFGSIVRGRGGAGGRALLNRTLAITAVGAITVAVAFLVSAPRMAGRLSDDPRLLTVLVVFGIALPGAALLRVAAAATRVSQDLRASVAIEDFGQPFVFTVLATALLATGGGVVEASVAAAVSFAAMGGAAVVWAYRWFPQAEVAEPARTVGRGELLAYSVPTALAGTVGVTMTWLDRLLVGYYLTEEAVGWYQVAAQASGIFAVILGAFAAIFGPMIAGLLDRGETGRLQELFRVTTKWGMLAVLPGAVLCLLFAEASVDAVFGAAYQPAAVPLMILVVGQLASVVTGAVGYLLMMAGRQNLWLGLSLAALAGDVVLNVVLIPRFGLAGAAVATTVSLAMLYASGLIAVRRTLDLWPYDRRFARVAIVVATVVGAGLLWRAVELPSVATVATVLAGGGLLTLAGWRLAAFDLADRILVAKLLRRS